MRFSETRSGTHAPRLTGRGKPAGIPAPDSSDHLGWSLHWGEECLNAIVAYIERGNPLDLEHAVRTARATWARVCRAKRYRYWDARYRETD